jgi:hypothetical protein
MKKLRRLKTVVATDGVKAPAITFSQSLSAGSYFPIGYRRSRSLHIHNTSACVPRQSFSGYDLISRP